LPKVDVKAARNNARALLKKFRSLARMAGRPLVDIKSPTVSDMPKTPAHGNSQEDHIVGVVNAKAEVDKIQQAMSFLPAESYWVLYYSYFTPDYMTGWEIADKIGASDDKVVNWRKNKALLEFAEAYPGQVLLEFLQN